MIKKIEKIFSLLAKSNPSPRTELNYINEFTLLVAIILSAQSTDIGVNKATDKLFKIIRTPEDLKNMGLDILKTYIKSLGLYNNKAKNLIALVETLTNHFDGEIPKELMELEKLPGVGSKTARVFLNCAHKIPVIAVDTHVYRVSRRIGIVQSDKIKQVEEELNKLVPIKWKLHAHHWLILHGRYICKARKPECSSCIIKDYCDYYQGKINLN